MIHVLLIFFIVLGFILILSKYELGIVLSAGALLFAILAQINIIDSLLAVLLNPSIILLAIAVTMIPILGEIMSESGLMLELVQKMKISKKASLMMTPAFFGLLPVAGGALMSAPILDQIDSNLNSDQKVAINVWYRHVLIFIYPISSALIVASIISGIPLYLIFMSLLMPFIVLILIGYVILIRKIENEDIESERDVKRVIRNLLPLIITPIIDFFGRTFLEFPYPEVFLLVGLIISTAIALKIGKMSISKLKPIAIKMQLWRFPLLILAMFWFLEVFIRSEVPTEVGKLNLHFFLFICLGFFLGFATGRIQLPLSILIPIYLIQYGLKIMFLLDFVFLYSAIFLGYIITPIHPCVAYSKEFFKVAYKDMFISLAKPTFTCFGILIAIYTVFLIL
ncbi:MAG: DUF401 family protein [Promethearchaeota archaeon]|nr:MAG: DUF401 family protein [Candidatus Lokiarchaeota archaeon]